MDMQRNESSHMLSIHMNECLDGLITSEEYRAFADEYLEIFRRNFKEIFEKT